MAIEAPLIDFVPGMGKEELKVVCALEGIDTYYVTYDDGTEITFHDFEDFYRKYQTWAP